MKPDLLLKVQSLYFMQMLIYVKKLPGIPITFYHTCLFLLSWQLCLTFHIRLCSPLTCWTVLKKHDDILAAYIVSIRSLSNVKTQEPVYSYYHSLWTSDTVRRHRSVSTFTEILASCRSTRPLPELMIICHHINWGGSYHIRFSASLKNRIRTGNHRNDNLRCHQWWQSWHHDSYQFSVTEIPFHLIWDRFSDYNGYLTYYSFTWIYIYIDRCALECS